MQLSSTAMQHFFNTTNKFNISNPSLWKTVTLSRYNDFELILTHNWWVIIYDSSKVQIRIKYIIVLVVVHKWSLNRCVVRVNNLFAVSYILEWIWKNRTWNRTRSSRTAPQNVTVLTKVQLMHKWLWWNYYHWVGSKSCQSDTKIFLFLTIEIYTWALEPLWSSTFNFRQFSDFRKCGHVCDWRYTSSNQRRYIWIGKSGKN